MSDDIFEKAFGKEPVKGYKFNSVEVEIVDNASFKGFDIAWSAQGIGFGHIFVGWGINVPAEFPKQQGFYSDTECMSEEFVRAVLRKAAPQMAKIIMDKDVTK